ncbi:MULTISPECIES: hypothetical protein [unclassified Calothrix]|uniref:hypothetical protein n=1 Tax=unclassified Calothrix TaxID=2619626 RepID=UPI001F553E1F|nr:MULTISPECIES: hypothetical protein [unclassified Calothrix]
MESGVKYMFPCLKYIGLGLTNLSLLTASIAIISKPINAGEPIIDNNCQYHVRTPEVFRKIPPQKRGTIYLTSAFDVNRQKYFLQVYKFPNSTGVFCLATFNAQPQKLKQSQLIQDKIIEKVAKDSSRKANYIVTVRGGINDDFLRIHYRLNLSNPNQPKVTPIIIIYK